MRAWEQFLLLQEKELGAKTVEQWLKSFKIIHFDARNLYLEAKDAFQISWFEEHMRSKVQKMLLSTNGRPIKVHLSIPDSGMKKKVGYKPQLNLVSDSVDPKATFESYIAGEINEVTVQLYLESLAKSPAFNPIFLYGPSGSGKTHLLMAAANYFHEKSVFYISAETLTQHVVSAIRNGAMEKFRKLYRASEVLLIDDIHLLSHRGATQEELFHTFNSLHMSGKQIILSSNATPNNLIGIEQRLTSRFEWGISLSLQRLKGPDLEKLLQSRLDILDFPLGQPVRELLISHFNSHPKSLLRALEALVLRSHLDRIPAKEISADRATIFLSKLIEEERKSALTPEKIIHFVSEFYGIRPEDILGKSQLQECALPRQICMFLCRMELKIPFVKIGEFFSRDHSTVMTSVKAIQKKIDIQALSLADIYKKIKF